MTSLFDSLTLGELNIPNRIIMAPLTRMRSHQPGNIPTALNATYYQQRASAGLIISEATQIIPEGQGYPATPGIHSPEQINGWSLVTQAVHERGGRIFLQLWHVGRISHSSFQPDGQAPWAPSSITPQGNTLTSSGKQVPFETPRSLSATQIAHLLNQYELAAQHAQQAGFDGVEIHGANGYLLDQFLQDGSNQRVDIYGGSVENRARLLFQVIERCVKIWGKGRVGVRLSPYGTFNDMKDSDPVNLFRYVVEGICNVGLAYIHLIEPRSTSAGGSDKTDESAPSTAVLFGPIIQAGSLGTKLISAGGYNRAEALLAIAEHKTDAVAFGRFYISNPDLVERLRENHPLTPYERATFYGGGEKGYTDYPVFSLQKDM